VEQDLWLCPVEDRRRQGATREGMLEGLSLGSYLLLVDYTSRLCRQGKAFLHHLITVRKVAYSTCNQKVGAIRFFYRHVLGQQDFQLRVPAKRNGRLPEPLSRGQIGRLFDVTTNTKHRVLLMTAHGGGLPVTARSVVDLPREQQRALEE